MQEGQGVLIALCNLSAEALSLDIYATSSLSAVTNHPAENLGIFSQLFAPGEILHVI